MLWFLLLPISFGLIMYGAPRSFSTLIFFFTFYYNLMPPVVMDDERRVWYALGAGIIFAIGTVILFPFKKKGVVR